MESNQDKLHILGKVSSVIVRKLQKNSGSAREHLIWLFAGYCFSGYKVGDLFDIFIRESDQKWNHDYKIRLQRIYDEFGRSYSSIPEGYKTICLFECSPAIPSYIKRLPTLKTWELTKESIYLCNHEDIDLLRTPSNNFALFNALSETVIFNLRKKHKKVFSMQDVAGILPKENAEFIIDNLLLSGALKKHNNELVLSE